MDPLKIEEADRKFVHKLHQLRSKLADRQTENQNRPPSRALPRTMAMILTPLIFAGVVFVVFINEEEVASNGAMHRIASFDSMQARLAQTAIGKGQTVAQSGGNPTEQQSLATDSPTLATTVPLERAPIVPRENLKSEIDGEPAADSEIAGGPAAFQNQAVHEPGVEPFAAGQESEGVIAVQENDPVIAAQDIELVSAVVCDGVRDRQHLDEKDRFDMTHAPRAYVWTEVRSRAQPFVIKHVYYLNGLTYCEVPLEITFPRMRTWSYITLSKADQVGAWTVEITYNDRILKKVAFQVQ
jgi:hypothetical protein